MPYLYFKVGTAIENQNILNHIIQQQQTGENLVFRLSLYEWRWRTKQIVDT